jgi:hypothetical protein
MSEPDRAIEWTAALLLGEPLPLTDKWPKASTHRHQLPDREAGAARRGRPRKDSGGVVREVAQKVAKPAAVNHFIATPKKPNRSP